MKISDNFFVLCALATNLSILWKIILLDNDAKITRLKQNENGDYEATIEEGVKLTLSNDGEQAESTIEEIRESTTLLINV